MINHHLSDEYLVEYAAGSLDDAESIVVSSHICMCPECRARVETYESVGAVLLEGGETEAVSNDALDAVMAMIDKPVSARDTGPKPIEFDRATLEMIPPPARAYLPADLAALNWKKLARGVEEAGLVDDGEMRVSLLRVRPGRKMPAHTHSGEEYTLVLDGGYRDAHGHYRRGDIGVADGGVDHAPVADDDRPCLCLLVRKGSARLTGPVGRLLNPFIRG